MPSMATITSHDISRLTVEKKFFPADASQPHRRQFWSLSLLAFDLEGGLASRYDLYSYAGPITVEVVAPANEEDTK